MSAQELPLRPLTTGEILDAAVAVLRRRPGRLLGYALALAAAEQLVLYVFVRARLRDPHDYLTFVSDPFGTMQKIVAVGMGTEAFIFVLLGTVAAGMANGLLLRGAGVPVPPPGPRRVGATLVLALLVGVCATAAAWLVVPWVFWFMVTCLAAPALMLDDAGRRGPAHALGRSVRLVGWAHLRPGGLRLLGYLPWLALRLVVGPATMAAVTALTGTLGPTASAVLGGAVYALINTVGYATVACLDAVNYLETRMRLEGLDIALSRVAARGPAVPR